MGLEGLWDGERGTGKVAGPWVRSGGRDTAGLWDEERGTRGVLGTWDRGRWALGNLGPRPPREVPPNPIACGARKPQPCCFLLQKLLRFRQVPERQPTPHPPHPQPTPHPSPLASPRCPPHRGSDAGSLGIRNRGSARIPALLMAGPATGHCCGWGGNPRQWGAGFTGCTRAITVVAGHSLASGLGVARRPQTLQMGSLLLPHGTTDALCTTTQSRAGYGAWGTSDPRRCALQMAGAPAS